MSNINMLIQLADIKAIGRKVSVFGVFLVRIFPEKYGPEKLRIRALIFQLCTDL